MKKVFYLLLVLNLLLYPALSFEWPTDSETLSAEYYSYFGQLRGGTISNSLILKDESNVKAWSEGFVTAIINEYEDESVFFPSTLGNVVIIAHKDSILSVYANIDKESIDKKESAVHNEGSIVNAKDNIGRTGCSAWQEEINGLEFQIVDTKNNTFINPRTLMPRVGNEIEIHPSGVVLQNRNGRNFKLSEVEVLPSGVYKVYQKRAVQGVPYRTSIFVNGIVVDELSFNILRQDENFICVSGKKNYSKSILYPSPEIMLVGEASLPVGKNTLRVTLYDMLGKEASANYQVSNY